MQCAVYNSQCKVSNLKCTVCITECTEWSLQCSVWSMQCAVCSVQSALCSVYCAVCSVPYGPLGVFSLIPNPWWGAAHCTAWCQSALQCRTEQSTECSKVLDCTEKYNIVALDWTAVQCVYNFVALPSATQATYHYLILGQQGDSAVYGNSTWWGDILSWKDVQIKLTYTNLGPYYNSKNRRKQESWK